MQLPAQQRRDVIEDLLDINIFSKMNSILKEKQTGLKDKLKDINYQFELIREKISLQKKYILEVEDLNNDQVDEKQAEIALYESEIAELQSFNNTMSDEIETLSNGLEESLKICHDKRQNLLHYKSEFTQKIRLLVKDSKLYEEHDNCPTCSQSIPEELIKTKLSEAKNKAIELQSALDIAQENSKLVEEKLEKLNDSTAIIRYKTLLMSGNNREIVRIRSQIETLSTAISKIKGNEGDIKKSWESLQALENEKEEYFETKLTINDEFNYNAVMMEMLKDTGIKTKVIKQYIPVINRLVNQYLQILDFYVHFNLDESFTETIKSRHRDSFTYDSFSEGEKQRIDLALLFTWRMIAKMKNSVATNLLVLDETFDSSLDHDGVDNLMKILYTLDDDTNVFVISHKGEILDGKFKQKIEFTKDKNFSKILA